MMMVVVKEPTPPGTGDMTPATSSTSGAASPQMDLPSGVGFTPASITTAPGVIISLVTRPANPAAATTISPFLHSPARSLVLVWHTVMVASRLIKRLARGRPTVSPLPTRVTFLPRSSMPARSIRAMQAKGVAGTRARCSCPPRRYPLFTGCTPSISFTGAMDSITFSLLMCLGRGSSTNMPCTFGVLVPGLNLGQDLFLRGVGRHGQKIHHDAQLVPDFYLGLGVPDAGVVVPHQKHGHLGLYSLGFKRLDLFGDLFADFVGYGQPFDKFCWHAPLLSLNNVLAAS